MADRNANVPEPLRSILNGMSPKVPSVTGNDVFFPSLGHDPETEHDFDDDMFDGDEPEREEVDHQAARFDHARDHRKHSHE